MVWWSGEIPFGKGGLFECGVGNVEAYDKKSAELGTRVEGGKCLDY